MNLGKQQPPVEIVPAGVGPTSHGAPSDEQIGVDVGEFRQGTAASRLALARYLVGRAVLEYLSFWFYLVAVIFLILGGVSWWLVSAWLGVPLVLVGFSVLGIRSLFAKLVGLVTGAGHFGPIEKRLMDLVADTGSDVRRELRRIGLPSHSWTLPLLPIRLIGRRRAQTVERMKRFEVDRVVPAARVDELHLVLRDAGILRQR